MKTTDAKIVYSPCPPSSKDVIWGKTVNGKIEFQTFGNEGWKTVAKEDILKDIFQIKEEILEELTQSDWAENDTESLAHILNRTHYIIQPEETETLLDEESLGGDVEATTIGEGPYSVTGFSNATLVVGTKYRVSVVDENGFVFADDKIVEAVTMYAPIYGTPWSGPAEFTEQVVIPIYGDVSLENPVGLAAAITEENGLIIINTPDYDSYSNQPFTVTLKEITQEEEVQQLDEKFLPETKKYQGDWGESDEDSPNFIKNKPTIKAGQGESSIIEGDGITASGDSSHAEGSYTTARGIGSHAEGAGTTASGNMSHAEGTDATASGASSHAEGYQTTASGPQSHAEGNQTTASGYCSHAEGYQTTANHRSQHVVGEYNIADPSTNQATARGNYVEIVGNGVTSSAKSNARTLDWSGNETLAGNLTIGGASGATLKVESGALKVSFDGGTTWLTVSAS